MATMVLPHLVPAKMKDSYDGSVEKTISRRKGQGKEADIQKLSNEARVLQFWLPRNSNKNDNSEMKQFNRMMGAG